MTPAAALSQLNRHLATHGQPVLLRRLASDGSTSAEVECKAFVRGRIVTLSPTAIVAAGWPGEIDLPPGQDARIPLQGDWLIVHGRPRRVAAAQGIYLGGVLVRIDIEAG